MDVSMIVPSTAAIVAAFESFFGRPYEPQDGDDDFHVGKMLTAADAADAGLAGREVDDR